MNKKSTRYFLIVGVVAVWGTILYRIVDAISESSELPLIKSTRAESSKVEQPDSFILFANYPDPFLTEDTLEAVSMIVPLATVEAPPILSSPAQPEKIDLSFIQYHGMISNPSSKMKTALITINGKDYTSKEKQVLEPSITLIRVHPDKITITYKGRRFSIPKAM